MHPLLAKAGNCILDPENPTGHSEGTSTNFHTLIILGLCYAMVHLHDYLTKSVSETCADTLLPYKLQLNKENTPLTIEQLRIETSIMSL